MAKTKRDVIEEALRHIGVANQHHAPDAADYARAEKHFDSQFDGLDEVHEIGVSWTENNVPEWAFIPMSLVVAGSVCTGFDLPQYRGEEAKGMTRLRAYAANEARRSGAPNKAEYF